MKPVPIDRRAGERPTTTSVDAAVPRKPRLVVWVTRLPNSPSGTAYLRDTGESTHYSRRVDASLCNDDGTVQGGVGRIDVVVKTAGLRANEITSLASLAGPQIAYLVDRGALGVRGMLV